MKRVQWKTQRCPICQKSASDYQRVQRFDLHIQKCIKQQEQKEQHFCCNRWHSGRKNLEKHRRRAITCEYFVDSDPQQKYFKNKNEDSTLNCNIPDTQLEGSPIQLALHQERHCNKVVDNHNKPKNRCEPEINANGEDVNQHLYVTSVQREANICLTPSQFTLICALNLILVAMILLRFG